MPKIAFFKIVTSIAPVSGVLVLGQGSNNYIEKMHEFFKNVLFFNLIHVFGQWTNL